MERPKYASDIGKININKTHFPDDSFYSFTYICCTLQFVKDFIRNERVTGLKIKIKNVAETAQREIVVNFDGEIMKLCKPEFEVRSVHLK